MKTSIHALLAVLVFVLALCPALAAATQQTAPAPAAKPPAQEPAPAPEAEPTPHEAAPAPAAKPPAQQPAPAPEAEPTPHEAAPTPAAKPAAQESAPAPGAEPTPHEVAPPPAVKPAAPEAAAGSTGSTLILFRPSMRFEDIRSDAFLPAQAAEEAEYEQHLLNAARKGVGSKATVLDMDTLEPPASEAGKQLHDLASRLARGNVNEEAMQALGVLAALDERRAVLVQFFRLKTGPGRSWNPNSGAITSSMASTLIQVALVSCKTGKVIWRGEQLIRNKALKPTDANFHKALALLYQDFDIK